MVGGYEDDALVLFRLLLHVSNLLGDLLEVVLVGRILCLELCEGGLVNDLVMPCAQLRRSHLAAVWQTLEAVTSLSVSNGGHDTYVALYT